MQQLSTSLTSFTAQSITNNITSDLTDTIDIKTIYNIIHWLNSTISEEVKSRHR